MMTNPIGEARQRVLPKLQLLASTNGWQERSDVLSQFVRQRYHGHADPIQILEAGCGRSLYLDLGDVCFQLTGIALNGKALATRQTEMRVASDHMGLIYAVEKDIPTGVTELAGAPSGLAAEAR